MMVMVVVGIDELSHGREDQELEDEYDVILIDNYESIFFKIYRIRKWTLTPYAISINVFTKKLTFCRCSGFKTGGKGTYALTYS